MKVCAACHTDLPKDSYSKKQWKLDECQRRCKVCTSDNRDVQPTPEHGVNESTNTNTSEIIKGLDSISLDDNAVNVSDEELFKQPPTEDCPICFIRMPYFGMGCRYQTCCGKQICCGCVYAFKKTKTKAIPLCPFCRTPYPASDTEMFKRERKRVKEKDDSQAMYNIGVYYSEGLHGYPKDHTKALEFYHRSAKFGNAGAYNSIGTAYNDGEGIEVDKKKAVHYYQLAALGGSVTARVNLGNNEVFAGKFDRALKHYMIALAGGCGRCLKEVQHLYSNGLATKDDYMKALRAYQEYLDEIRSSQRDEAAAAHEDYRYY